MTQSPFSFKSFEPRPGHTPCHLPLLIDALAGGECLPAYWTLDDLREMAKFGEIPNIDGLAAYPVERPGRLDGQSRSIAPDPELPGGVRRPLGDALTATPLVMAQGLAGPPSAALMVQLIVPQAFAHLAAFARQCLRPCEPDPERPPRPDYTLLCWPAPLTGRHGRPVKDRLIGHWPATPENEPTHGPGGTGLVIGHDDPALLAAMVADAWRVQVPQPGTLPPDFWAARPTPLAEIAHDPAAVNLARRPGAWVYGLETDGTGRLAGLHTPATAPSGWVILGSD